MQFINSLCDAAEQSGASDLFLLDNSLPQLRLNGSVVGLGEQVVSEEEMVGLWKLCGADLITMDFDGIFVSAKGNRYRVNLFRSLGARGAVLRPIKTTIPKLDSLGVPRELLISWVLRPSGLILVTGPTGSGKSTTSASCLQWLNLNSNKHIVTIEDPIEFLFQPVHCLFTQREIGLDTPTFAEGLRRSLRQSPDVILLGEIRDGPSAITALQAAETGHLVMATMHSANVQDSMERISRLFDDGERTGVLHVLSQQLVGILCQRLLPSSSGDSQVLALEHFENQAVTRKWILEGKFHELQDFLERGDNSTNRSFPQSLVEMVRSGLITESTALDASPYRQQIKRQLRGIQAQ